MWTFRPILKTTIWGGQRIPRRKGLAAPSGSVGESWEISGVPGSESVVADGPDRGLTLTQLLDRYGSRLLGERNYNRYGHRFPLLVKLIDAADNLSLQVHPDDNVALRHGHANGKSEMWYVLDADRGARIISGFRRPVGADEFGQLAGSGRILDEVNHVEIRPGQAFFIPAGHVHALEKGAFVLEIQQTSDVTYRIFDYDRLDSEGRKRELHSNLAAEALDFGNTSVGELVYADRRNIPVNLVTSPHFTVNLLHLEDEIMRDYSELDTFVIITATKGEARVRCKDAEVTVTDGSTVLIPASAPGIEVIPCGDFMAVETFIK